MIHTHNQAQSLKGNPGIHINHSTMMLFKLNIQESQVKSMQLHCKNSHHTNKRTDHTTTIGPISKQWSKLGKQGRCSAKSCWYTGSGIETLGCLQWKVLNNNNRRGQRKLTKYSSSRTSKGDLNAEMQRSSKSQKGRETGWCEKRWPSCGWKIRFK